jgi:hypothetical protein
MILKALTRVDRFKYCVYEKILSIQQKKGPVENLPAPAGFSNWLSET